MRYTRRVIFGSLLSLCLINGASLAANSQESPPPTVCDENGTCLLGEDMDQPYTIDCDEHAGTGCPTPAEPEKATPSFTG